MQAAEHWAQPWFGGVQEVRESPAGCTAHGRDASAPQGPWGEGPGAALRSQLSPSAGWWHPQPSPRDAEAGNQGREQSATSVTGDSRRGPRAHR